MKRRQAVTIGLALGIGVGLRLMLAILFVGNYDERSYEIVAEIERRGANIYVETTRYNYTPAWAIMLHGLDSIARAFDIPLHEAVRSFLTLVDVANAILIGLIGRSAVRASATAGFCAYLLNPVAILIVGLHGQFETVAALPLLAAVTLAGHPSRKGSTVWTWLLGTAALVIKHILAFQFWMLFWYRFTPVRRVLLVAASGALFLASFLPFLPEGLVGIQRNVFGYSGLPGIYGFGSLLPYPIPVFIFLVVMTALPLVALKLDMDLAQAMRFSAVTLLAVIFGIGEQYFLIPVLFASAFRGRWYWAFTAAATLFLAASPNNLNLFTLPPLWNVVWIVAFGWASWLVLAPLIARRGAPATYTAR